MEVTLLLIKPSAVRKGLVYKIRNHLADKGFNIVQSRGFVLSKELAKEFYKEHKGKDFYEDLVDFISSGPVLALMIEGDNVIQKIRDEIGDTDPKKAAPGTIRNLYGGETPRENGVHASDSLASANRELRLAFDF